MKKLALFFSLSLFSLSSIFAQETFTYKDADIVNDSRKQADQALCIGSNLTPVRSVHTSSGSLSFRLYQKPDYKQFTTKEYSAPGEPHKIISLKNGGFAVGATNHFGILDKDFNVLKSIGSKMLDWRAQTTNPDNSSATMESWKHNDGGTGTAVDFLELAETPDGNYVCAVFLFHSWNTNGAAQMNLGLAISDLTNGGKMTIHDLDMVADENFDIKSAVDVSKYLEIACIDNSHAIIGYTGFDGEKNFQMTVINFKKILEGAPLDAQVWQGNLNPFNTLEQVTCGMFAENGTLYYTVSDGIVTGDYVVIGKAKWDGSKLSVISSQTIKIGNNSIYNPHIACNLSSDYFVLAGSSYSTISGYSRQPYFVKIKKSDLSISGKTAIVKGDNYYKPHVLDVAPLSNSQIAVLFRGKAEDGGSFYLGTLQFND